MKIAERRLLESHFSGHIAGRPMERPVGFVNATCTVIEEAIRRFDDRGEQHREVSATAV